MELVAFLKIFQVDTCLLTETEECPGISSKGCQGLVWIYEHNVMGSETILGSRKELMKSVQAGKSRVYRILSTEQTKTNTHT